MPIRKGAGWVLALVWASCLSNSVQEAGVSPACLAAKSIGHDPNDSAIAAQLSWLTAAGGAISPRVAVWSGNHNPPYLFGYVSPAFRYSRESCHLTARHRRRGKFEWLIQAYGHRFAGQGETVWRQRRRPLHRRSGTSSRRRPGDIGSGAPVHDRCQRAHQNRATARCWR